MKHTLTALILSMGLTASIPALADLMTTAPESSSVSTMTMPELQAAAQAGNVRAQFYLASRYKLGQGVPQDLEKAFTWFQKAAIQGAAPAQLNLGQMYAEGKGVNADMTQAKLWLGKAAKQGDNRASYNLALLEERSKNLANAYQWYDLSARDGMLDQRIKDKAQGKIRTLAANLSPQDIQDAKNRADRWIQTDDGTQ
ncbi:MAG: sel1 repeat family protein [Candidatus Saccharibacteria bacterium]|nr:sel1 repeat family protein [Moraxellaceae bacterium]